MKRPHRRIALTPFFFVMGVFVVSVSAEMAPAGDLGEAVELARQYLKSTDSHEKARLSRELAEYDRDWKDVIRALRPRPDRAVKPGYYKEGHYGIRIENLILVTAPEAIEGGELPMHRFENLTFAPIDLNLVDRSLLSDAEAIWLNAYHVEVLEKIGPLVEGEAKAWLEKATRVI